MGPRADGRPRRKTSQSPVGSSSPKSPGKTSPSPKKRNSDGVELTKASPKKDKLDEIESEENDDDFEADTALAIKLSLESANIILGNLTEKEEKNADETEPVV